MTRVQITIAPRDTAESGLLEMEAPDVPTALAIADINCAEGRAEVWDGRRRLARLTKHGGDHATYWELG